MTISIFCHHSWISLKLILGFTAHITIYVLYDTYEVLEIKEKLYNLFYTLVIHREIILGHLIQYTIFLGFHSFSTLLHNDITLTFKRDTNIFSDYLIQLKPVFINLIKFLLIRDVILELNDNNYTIDLLTQLGIYILDIIELGTSDFLIYHIYVFSIHITLLIILKGVFYSRNSRLVSDKIKTNFRYPCDGPGRGGTCQISSWDHLFLCTF